jgi:hypothetical protein
MPLSAQVLLSMVAHESSSGDLSRQMRVTPATYAVAFSDGTGANQAQVAFSASATVQDNGDEVYAFSGFADDRGTIAMAALKAVYFKNTGTVELELGRAGDWYSGPFVAERGVLVPPGGAVALVAPGAAGWSTAGTTAGIAVFNATETAGSYEIVLIGEGTVS